MNATQTVAKLEKRIAVVCERLLTLGPMHPGSVSRQYQVCGRPGCRCMRPKQPQRHGPYHKLAYVRRGKPVCRFVRTDCVAEVARRLATYKAFRRLIDQWIDLSVQRGVIEFFAAPSEQAGASDRKRQSRCRVAGADGRLHPA